MASFILHLCLFFDCSASSLLKNILIIDFILSSCTKWVCLSDSQTPPRVLLFSVFYKYLTLSVQYLKLELSTIITQIFASRGIYYLVCTACGGLDLEL